MPKMLKLRLIARYFFFCTYVALASAILLEIAFRLMPVADLFERGVVNETQPIIRYHPNQDIKYSIGWNFYQISKKTTTWRLIFIH